MKGNCQIKMKNRVQSTIVEMMLQNNQTQMMNELHYIEKQNMFKNKVNDHTKNTTKSESLYDFLKMYNTKQHKNIKYSVCFISWCLCPSTCRWQQSTRTCNGYEYTCAVVFSPSGCENICGCIWICIVCLFCRCIIQSRRITSTWTWCLAAQWASVCRSIPQSKLHICSFNTQH